MTILVTGATGFIGNKLVCELRKKGEKIKILSRNSYPDVDSVVCDLSSNLIPSESLEGVKTIFHLAGFTHNLRDARKVKDLYQRINVDATVELARLALKYNVKNFIFISSVKAGRFSSMDSCVSEMQEDNAKSVYGRTKREAELRLLEIGKNTNMQVSIIRPALVYGPNVKGNLRLILLGINQGWFPPLPEIGNKRSMIHVDDLVRAILFIYDSNNTNGEIFIATDGKNYSAAQIYNNLCEVLGKPIPNWRLPLVILKMISFISPNFKYKIQKLIGDEYYSSEKLESIGFKPKLTLRDMNEKIF